jgi:hypothetical protein
VTRPALFRVRNPKRKEPAVADVRKTKIVVDGDELTVRQTITELGQYVCVTKVVGRDRKRKLDLTGGIETKIDEPLALIRLLKQVVALPTARCTCDYRRGWSDHAEHCTSIYKASYDDEGYLDDD